MRKAEQRLWDTMRRNKPPGIYFDRVENYVGEGMPDVYVRMRQRATWVELKAPTAPARDGTRLLGDQGMRRGQINWHLQSASLNLATYVLIRDSLKRLWLVEGRHADSMNELTVAELDDVSVAGTWPEIFEVLRK